MSFEKLESSVTAMQLKTASNLSLTQTRFTIISFLYGSAYSRLVSLLFFVFYSRTESNKSRCANCDPHREESRFFNFKRYDSLNSGSDDRPLLIGTIIIRFCWLDGIDTVYSELGVIVIRSLEIGLSLLNLPNRGDVNMNLSS